MCSCTASSKVGKVVASALLRVARVELAFRLASKASPSDQSRLSADDTKLGLKGDGFSRAANPLSLTGVSSILSAVTAALCGRGVEAALPQNKSWRPLAGAPSPTCG